MDLLHLFESSSSSSTSESVDEDFFAENILPNVIFPEVLLDKPKNENYFEETVPLYSDKQFIEHFRVSREIVQRIKSKFEASVFYSKKDTGFQRIGSEKCILAFLWFASNESTSYRDVADRFNLSVSTLHAIVQNVTAFLSNLSSSVIVWPSVEECRTISNEFAEMGFPNAIGCIDGTHVRIDAPRDDAESYLNRKKYYSIQAQIVCDSNNRIIDVFIGYPGSVHDARVFRTSPLGQNIADKCKDYCLLGDSAYPCLRNLLTPYKDNGNLTNIQKKYNKNLSHCRVSVEHTIGILKQRFRQLYHIKSRQIDFICHFIRACCVLHNMCKDDSICSDLHENETEDSIGNESSFNNEIYEEDERDNVGLNYRNYLAAVMNI